MIKNKYNMFKNTESWWWRSLTGPLSQFNFKQQKWDFRLASKLHSQTERTNSFDANKRRGISQIWTRAELFTDAFIWTFTAYFMHAGYVAELWWKMTFVINALTINSHIIAEPACWPLPLLCFAPFPSCLVRVTPPQPCAWTHLVRLHNDGS